MKKLLIVLVLSALATAAVWAVSFRKEDLSQYIPQEQPIQAQNREKLLPLKKSLTAMCVNGEWKNLEKCFNISKTDRILARQETGEDPVERYISLLKDYASRMRTEEWEMTELVKNHNYFFFRIAGENGRRLCLSFTKRKGKFLFNSVTEEQVKRK